MKSQHLLAIGAAVILVLGGVLVFSNSKNSTTSNEPDTMMPQESGARSFADLMGMSGNQICTFEDEMGNSGTIYAMNGKFRGDFTGTTNGKVTNTYMISDGKHAYLWFDGSEAGFKMALGDMQNYSGTAPADQKTFDMNKKVDYKCDSWTVDETKYDLPNIEFQDFSSMMQGGPTGFGM